MNRPSADMDARLLAAVVSDQARRYNWPPSSVGPHVTDLADRVHLAVQLGDYQSAAKNCPDLIGLIQGHQRASGTEMPFLNEAEILRGNLDELLRLQGGTELIAPSRGLSRRVRLFAYISVRFLPPRDRQRYRDEVAAELADLPPKDQAAYSYRLFSHAWLLRRELKKRSRLRSTVRILVLQQTAPGAAAAAITAIAGAPGVYVAGALIGGCLAMIGWTVSSAERTANLVALIRAARAEDAERDGAKSRNGRS